jgi:hypothetical protein
MTHSFAFPLVTLGGPLPRSGPQGPGPASQAWAPRHRFGADTGSLPFSIKFMAKVA